MGPRRCIERRSKCGCGASEDTVDVRVTARREFAAKGMGALTTHCFAVTMQDHTEKLVPHPQFPVSLGF